MAGVNNGRRMKNSNDNDSSDAMKSKSKSICPFHAQGYCRFGKSCKLLHQVSSSSSTADNDALIVQEEIKISETLHCGLCFESILSHSKRFGLLLGCNHSFCLSCIREWRQNDQEQFEKYAVRKCPICRIPTYFIIPSNRMIQDPIRKRNVVNEYLKQLKDKECLYYKREGKCPFGTSCFYAHIGSNMGKKLNINHHVYVLMKMV